MGTALRRLTPLAVVGGLFVVLAVLASMSTPGIHRFNPQQLPQSPSPSPLRSSASGTPVVVRGESRSGAVTIPPWVQPVLIAIGAAIVLTLLAFLIWRIIANTVEARAGRLGRTTATITTRREAVLAVVDASIAELARDDGDPRSAVIICWVRLEEVAAAAGVPRSPGDTPADLVRRLLAAHDVTGDVLDTLADLYRAARYSPGEVFPSMRDDARRAFIRLRAELAGSAHDRPASRPRPRPSYQARSESDRP